MARPLDTRPPYNLEAEEAVIASILVDPSCLQDVLEILKPRDFHDDRCRWCYEACLSVDAVDQLTVTEEVARRGHLKEAGGAGYLSLLVSRIPTPFHAEYYARIVARLAAYRRFIEAAGKIAAIGYAAEDEDELQGYGRIRQIVDELMPHSGAGIVSPQQQAEMVMTIASDWKERRETVKFGYSNLDQVTGGMNGGDLIIVGARPSVGKSQILQEVALHNAYRQRCVLFASVEMSIRQLLERQIGMATHKPIIDLRHGKITPMDWSLMGDLSAALSTSKLYVMSGNMSLEGLAAKARTLKETDNLALLCFDHVQFMARRLGREYGDNLREKVGHTTNFLKSLAEELQIPVLAACQLSRVVEAREDHMPMLSDFKESGSIEEDADLALLLHRPELYKKCPEEAKGVMFIRIAKDRQGGRHDVIELKWSPELHRYAAPEKQQEMAVG